MCRKIFLPIFFTQIFCTLSRKPLSSTANSTIWFRRTKQQILSEVFSFTHIPENVWPGKGQDHCSFPRPQKVAETWYGGDGGRDQGQVFHFKVEEITSNLHLFRTQIFLVGCVGTILAGLWFSVLLRTCFRNIGICYITDCLPASIGVLVPSKQVSALEQNKKAPECAQGNGGWFSIRDEDLHAHVPAFVPAMIVSKAQASPSITEVIIALSKCNFFFRGHQFKLGTAVNLGDK